MLIDCILRIVGGYEINNNVIRAMIYIEGISTLPIPFLFILVLTRPTCQKIRRLYSL